MKFLIENYKHKNNNTSTIIGAKNPEQLKFNLHSTKLTLNTDELKKIDEVSVLPKEYPGWIVERHGSDHKKEE